MKHSWVAMFYSDFYRCKNCEMRIEENTDPKTLPECKGFCNSEEIKAKP